MGKILILTFLLSAFAFSSITTIELECKFEFGGWSILNSVYQCYSSNNHNFITDKSNREITAINGLHQDSNTNENVSLIAIESSDVFYFPQNLDKFFTLEGILIENSNLKEIKKEDLKPFVNLRVLYLMNNAIEIIEENLFEFNPKLEAIKLNNNKIALINSNSFDNFVDKLSTLFLSGNVCPFEDADDYNAKVNEIIAQIQSGNCTNLDLLPPPPPPMVPNQFYSTILVPFVVVPELEQKWSFMLSKVHEELTMKIEEGLKNQPKAEDVKVGDENNELEEKLIQKMKVENNELKEELKKVQEKLEATEIKMEGMNKQIEDLKGNLTSTMKNLDEKINETVKFFKNAMALD